MSLQEKTLYLDDGVSKIDAVIAYDFDMQSSSELQTFFNNLKAVGVVINHVNSKTDPRLYFAKLHVPEKVIERYASQYDIVLRKDRTIVLPEEKVFCQCLHTILTAPNPDPNDPIAKRAWKTIAKEKPTKAENCERIFILFQILDTIRFGEEETAVGIGSLVFRKIVIEAFPLHDGPCEWPEPDNGQPLNDRQLLKKYWANYRLLHKKQPLNTIKDYFGYECGIYFCFLGFYNKMLIFASIMGLLTNAAGTYFTDTFTKHHLDGFCNITAKLCNAPLKKLELTHYETIDVKANCHFIYLSIWNSNLAAFVYSIGIIIWCTIFKEGWKRQLNVYNVKWENPGFEDFVTRPQFKANKTNKIRPHEYTGEPEIYLPLAEQIIRYIISVSCFNVMVVVAIASIYGVMMFENYLLVNNFNRIQMVIFTAFVSLVCMIVLEIIFRYLSRLLGQVEMHQTNLGYEKSVILKNLAYSFINSYARLIYIAFFKGKYYPEPLEYPYPTENCLPPSCVSEVNVNLLVILIFKPLIMVTLNRIKALFAGKLKKYTLSPGENNPRWEVDYATSPMDRRFIINVMILKIIQFGMITFFSAGFPLGPLIALIHNTVTLRIYARTLVTAYKRPVERKRVSCIGVCFDIFEHMTYVAIIINALYAGFTCTFAHFFYDYKTNSALANSTAECMKTGAYELTNVYKFYEYQYYEEEKCYVPYSFETCQFNETTDAMCYSLEHYDLLFYKAYLALGFLLLGHLVSGLISYSIPDVPRDLKELLYYHAEKERFKEA